ncbi:hypothetical protein [Nocardia inohanensis]|uniref:hypothetical protein n=1 Tax=Nocardia inohanensis TaxID=209246 RepID=UPI00082EA37A|nr:hypothetical protein [Nocardia inohanensis]
MKISRERRNQPEPDAGQAQPAETERMRGDDAPDRQVLRPGHDGPQGAHDAGQRPAGGYEMPPGPAGAQDDPQMTQRMERGPGVARHENESVPPGAGYGAAQSDPHAGQPGHAGAQSDPRGAQPGHGSGRPDIPAAQSNPRAADGRHGGNGGERVLAEADLGRLRDQWREVQTMFVDDPRDAVTRANGLVEGTIQQLTETYAQRRQALENKWARSERDDTEELRQALRGYRQLFDQLLETAGAATNM